VSYSYPTVGRPRSGVDIKTLYDLDGPRLESQRGRDFPYPFGLAQKSTQPPVMWVSWSQYLGSGGCDVALTKPRSTSTAAFLCPLRAFYRAKCTYVFYFFIVKVLGRGSKYVNRKVR
jgi:hypothetical protein